MSGRFDNGGSDGLPDKTEMGSDDMNSSKISRITGFFSGPKFPVFMLLAMLFYQAFLAVTIFSPIGDGLWGKFVTDFRVWCFRYDPGSGAMRWSAAWVMLTEPLLLEALIIALWHRQLLEMVRFERRALLAPCAAALMTVAAIAGGLLWLAAGDAAAEETLPFPGERIRTALVPPRIELHNQHGDPVNLDDCRGKVVLMTAVYSTCGTACPMILFQARDAVAGLSEADRSNLTVMAISLDPEGDSLDLMARTAAAYGMDAPGFHFLNGDPVEVNAILDALSISRTRDPNTGQIDHANMYILIDEKGAIAFRLTLSDRHQSWLSDALKHLLAECPEPGGPTLAAAE